MTTLNLAQTSAPTKRAAGPPQPRVVGDGLFPDVTVDIACRVCGCVERVTLDYPALLCTTCLNDLSAVTERLAGDYATALQSFLDTSTALAQRAAGNAWYATTERARSEVEPKVFQQAWIRAERAGGENAALIQLRDRLDLLALQFRAAEQRYIVAQPELRAARAFLGEPVEV